MEEIWKDIEGYEGYYRVSNMGRVKSLNRTVIRNNGRNLNLCEKILKPQESGKYRNYLFVLLCKKNTYIKCKVHRLVAKAFLNNSNNLPMINHIDGDPSNNVLENLEWCNNSYNQKHAYKLGLRDTKGIKHPMAKLTESDVLEIREKIKLKKIYIIAKEYGVDWNTIYSIKTGQNWKHLLP